MALRSSISSALLGSLLALFAVPVGAVSSQGPAHDTGPRILNDRAAFHAFIESRPTPEEFQQAYPDVWLILPGDIVTRSFCSEYYRFLAELDSEGRITGGNLE
jgi:hypothetical protein